MKLLLFLTILLLPSLASAQCIWPDGCNDAGASAYTPNAPTDWKELAPPTAGAALDDLALQQGSSFICEATEAILRGDLIALAGQGAATASADGVMECSINNEFQDTPYMVGVALEGASSGERFAVLRKGIIPFGDLRLNATPSDCTADFDRMGESFFSVTDSECFAPGLAVLGYNFWGTFFEDGTDDYVWVNGAAPFVGVSDKQVGISQFSFNYGAPLNAALQTVFDMTSAVDFQVAGCLEKLYAAGDPTEATGTHDYFDLRGTHGAGTHASAACATPFACADAQDEYVVATTGGGPSQHRVDNLRCITNLPPGLLGSWIATVTVGGDNACEVPGACNEAQTCTIGPSTTDISCSDFQGPVQLTNADRLMLRITSTGAPTAANDMECSVCIVR